MLNRPLRLTALAGLLALVTACNRFDPPEQRINAAVAPAEATQRAVEGARAAIVALGQSAERERATRELEARLALRARVCAQGFTPAWYHGDAAIREAVHDRTCLAGADAELLERAAWLHAGALLALPPLRAPAQQVPPELQATQPVHALRLARDAGVAVLMTQDRAEVLELVSGRLVHAHALRKFRNDGEVSGNGRLLALAGSDDATRIVDATSGDVVLEVPRTHAYTWRWLDTGIAYVASAAAGAGPPAWLLDFTHWRQVPLRGFADAPLQVLKAPGARDDLVLFGRRATTRLRVVRTEADTTLQVVKEEPAAAAAAVALAVSTDGGRALGTQPGLTLTSLYTLETTTVPLAPLRVLAVVPTRDNDQVILQGTVPHQPGTLQHLLFSLSRQTIAPLDTAALPATRLVYVPSVRRLASIAGKRVAWVDAQPAGPERRLGEWLAGLQAQAEQRRRAAQAAGTWLPDGSIAPQPPPLAGLARDARVHAIAVHAAAASPRQRTIQVRVRKRTQPLVLVLSSHEAVQWVLRPEAGARLAAVLVASPRTVHVQGAGKARVVKLGPYHAHGPRAPEFQRLDRDVQLALGRRIDDFTVRYLQDRFEVGP